MQTVIRRCLRLKPTLARDLNDNAIAKKPGDYLHLSPGMLYSVGASLRHDYLKIEPLAIVKCRQRSNLVHQPARILDARQVSRNNRSQNPRLSPVSEARVASLTLRLRPSEARALGGS